MPKVLYNNCYGGYSFSARAVERFNELTEEKGGAYENSIMSCPRHDPILIKVVEELGLKAASGGFAALQFRELPSGIKYRIDEYDGKESVVTPEEYDWEIVP